MVLSIHRPQRETLDLAQVWADWIPSGASANVRLLIAVKEDNGSPLFLEEALPHLEGAIIDAEGEALGSCPKDWCNSAVAV